MVAPTWAYLQQRIYKKVASCVPPASCLLMSRVMIKTAGTFQMWSHRQISQPNILCMCKRLLLCLLTSFFFRPEFTLCTNTSKSGENLTCGRVAAKIVFRRLRGYRPTECKSECWHKWALIRSINSFGVFTNWLLTILCRLERYVKQKCISYLLCM